MKEPVKNKLTVKQFLGLVLIGIVTEGWKPLLITLVGVAFALAAKYVYIAYYLH